MINQDQTLEEILLSGSAKTVRQKILAQYQQLNVLLYDEWAQKISSVLLALKQEIKKNPAKNQSVQKRLLMLKGILNQIFKPKMDGNWRDAILGNIFTCAIDHVSRNNNLIVEHNEKKPEENIAFRHRVIPSKIAVRHNHFTSAFRGSTFVSNYPEFFNHPQIQVLDNVYGGYNYNSEGQSIGFTLALGDGCGGHYLPQQDQNIARASWFAVKHAVRLFSHACNDVELAHQLPNIVHSVAQEIQRKSLGENTTLLCVRVFVELERLKLVGCNVGDGMLISWDPVLQYGQTLSPARVTQAGVAMIPNGYRSSEICPIIRTLPEETILIALSDGVYDMLPGEEKEGAYPNGLTYIEKSLVNTEITSLLRGTITADEVANRIIQACFLKTNQIYQQKLATHELFKMGDDLSILSMKMQKGNINKKVT